MKKILNVLALFALLSTAMAQPKDFINPLNFDGSDEQKQAAINYITKQVKKQYCESGLDMCQDMILRMMEDENLNAFKRLTNADNRTVFNRVLTDYCKGIGMCDYVTIDMMYNENIKASKKKLEW